MTPPPDQPPAPNTDTSGKQPYQSGLLSRIVAIHFPTRPVAPAEQGLLRISGGAVALDTGDMFAGMSTGATGKLIATKPFTVLTPGIVVYGQPQHGKPCFMACTDGTTILKGHQDVGGDMEGIVWDSVYGANGLCALSFAGGAFFVVYRPASSGPYDSSCAMSVDGENFSEIGNIYPGLPHLSVHDSLTPGSVAFNGKGYATAGMFFADPNYPNIIGIDDNNMAWGSSGDGSGWSASCTPSETASPGIQPDAIHLGSGSAFTTIAGGAGRFVAAATSRTTFQSTVPVPGTGGTQFTQYVYPTAAAAVSNDGNSWTTNKLPGAIEGNYIETGLGTHDTSDSRALSVAFVRTGADTGYFVISAVGSMTSSGAPGSAASWCWKGDGSSWQLIKQTGDASFGTVSAIARDLTSTKVVNI